MLFVDNAGADAVLGMVPFARELLCMGAEVVMVANSYAAINDITATELTVLVDGMAASVCPIIAAARAAAKLAMASNCGNVPPYPGLRCDSSTPSSSGSITGNTVVQERNVPRGTVTPKLYICGSGSGSPCLDLRRVSNQVAMASVGVDLLIIEGMGRAIHTNYNTSFRCCALKLAMIKTARIAEKLFDGNLFDCMCRFDTPA